VRLAIVNLTAGGLSGGYVKYLRRLVPLLLQHHEITDLRVMLPDTARQVFAGESWPIRTWSRHPRLSFKQIKEMVRDHRPDVVFIPTAAWIHAGGTPVVNMVRNMEPLEAPFGGNSIREALRNLARRVAAHRACRRATRVIAVSDHVRDFLLQRWQLPHHKIAMIHHGVDRPDTWPLSRRPAVLGDGFADPFVFTAGSLRPARGLVDLVEAMGRLKSLDLPARAVIAGRADSGAESHRRWLIRRAGDLGLSDRIIWTEGLDASEMRWCYEGCAAFVTTSRAEACPNVALEAMSYGCACVSVDHPPMPEFFGDAAVYYRAGDSDALADRLASLLGPSQDRPHLQATARARARHFDWRTTAERTITELRRAMGTSAPEAAAAEVQRSSG
jgi:glycosyltransferase involved in cell wall biosynthesis